MARLVSTATGNFTASGTWSLVDTTSYLNSETGTTNVPSSAGAGARSAAFTPGAITITGIAVKLGQRIGTTGTLTIELYNNTLGAVVAATTITINVADLPASGTASEGGWIVTTFASVLLLAATDYMVQVTSSSATQVSLHRDATANNWSRMLVTSTNQAPAAGDDMVVAGNVTGAGTGNDITVTMNETAATDYGANSTSNVTPAIAVCNRGTLKWADGSAGNPLLRVSGYAIVYANGIMTMGTVATPIPRDSTAILEFDCAADGDFGLVSRNLSTLTLQGLSRTSGKLIDRCLLNTDEAVNSTSLGVDTDTGWLDNDEIAVASTTRTATQSEKGALNGAAGASSLTVDGFGGAGGGLANAHSGTSPTQAEVILLTRNVRVRSVSSTAMTFVQLVTGAVANFDWAEFYFMGENATGKRGIEVSLGTGGAVNFSIENCSLHDFEDGGLYWNVLQAAATITSAVFSNNVAYLLASVTATAINFSGTITSTNWTMDNNILMRTGTGNWVTLSDNGGTLQTTRS
mgnify:FL=1